MNNTKERMDVYGHLNRYVVNDNTYTHKKTKPYEIRWNFGENMREFWTFYCQQVDHTVSHEIPVYHSIMEKCSDATPINITMCFKYHTHYKLRMDNSALVPLLHTIQATIRQVYEIDYAREYDTLTSCYLEGKEAYVDDQGDYCNICTFIFPKCVVPVTSQVGVFRDKLIENLLNTSILRYFDVQPKNGQISEILLRSPPKGDWTLYGSMSNDFGTVMEIREWYTVLPRDTYDFNIEQFSVDLCACDFLQPSFHSDCTTYNFDPMDINNDVDFWTPMILSSKYCATRTKVRMATRTVPKTIEADDVDNDVSIARRLLDLIAIRCEEDWIIVGKALYNCVYQPVFQTTEYGSDENEAMSIWLANANDRGYDVNNLTSMWSSFSQGNNYTLRTIGWFAKCDSHEAYKSWHQSWYRNSISISMERSSREHVIFSESFFKYYWLTCGYSEDNMIKCWYKYQGHRWIAVGPTEMLSLLNVFRREVELYGKELYTKLIECNDSNQKDIINNKIKKAGDIITNYCNDAWRKNIIEASKMFFLIRDLCKKLDDNRCITGVLNGVIEVNNKMAIFRHGRPEDYITKFTPVMYEELGDNHIMAREYMKFIREVFPNEELAETQLRFFSSLLYGVPYKYFYIWTGEGDNGKSTLVRMLNATLGDEYVVNVSPTFITRRRVSSSNPTPEIADMKGSRLVVIQEPDEGESLQPGIIKEATGGDKIRARKLNDNGGPFLPTYQIVLQCNEIPEAQKQEAMKNRVRIVPFLSKWVDDDKLPSHEECVRNNLFRKDPEFMSNVGKYATACLYYMVKYFEKFRQNPVNKIPEIVKIHTDTYWNTVDKFYQYIHERLEWKYIDFMPGEPYINPHDPFQRDENRTPDEYVILALRDAYCDYINWLRDTGRFDSNDKTNTYPKIIDNLSRYLGKPTLDGWLGIQPRALQVNY